MTRCVICRELLTELDIACCQCGGAMCEVHAESGAMCDECQRPLCPDHGTVCPDCR